MYSFRKQTVALIGINGQVGTPLAQNLLALGHELIALVRPESNNTELSRWETAGVIIRPVADMADVDTVAEALTGAETLICAVPASKHIITELEPIWLEASLKAGINRFVPSEFGSHTQNIAVSEGVMFDSKKWLHKKIFESGIGWTLFYNGGFFDYFLPNLRFFQEITTFGDLSFPIYTHDINDIGRFAALALTDDRTLNHCVQMDYSALSQQEMLDHLRANYPEAPFVYKHYSSAYINRARYQSSDKITAKKGAETDQERWGINYVNYVQNKLVAFNESTLRATDLYPDFQLSRTPEQALADPAFVFEASNM